MEKDEYDKYYDNLVKSTGHKKLLNYFAEVINSIYFQDFITKTRAKYQIPEKGFLVGNENFIFPPEQWVLRNDREKCLELRKDIRKISKKYHLHILDGSELIEGYLFYNLKENSVYPDTFNMCLFADLVEEKEDPFDIETQKDDDLLFPIAIRISPYASQRDILDYVKRAYKMKIAPMQDHYKIKGAKLGKFKKKKARIKERNNFIYQNRHLPKKKIMQLIGDKFGKDTVIDYGYIGKIISMENKRRKEM